MKLNVADAVVLGLLGAAIHWLIARSLIFSPLWKNIASVSIYLDKLLACAACSGFWIGIGAGLARLRPISTGVWWFDVVATGLLGIYLVPVFEGVMIWGLSQSAIPQEYPGVVPLEYPSHLPAVSLIDEAPLPDTDAMPGRHPG